MANRYRNSCSDMFSNETITTEMVHRGYWVITAKCFSDSIGVPFYGNILDSNNVFFRWESDPLNKLGIRHDRIPLWLRNVDEERLGALEREVQITAHIRNQRHHSS